MMGGLIWETLKMLARCLGKVVIQHLDWGTLIMKRSPAGSYLHTTQKDPISDEALKSGFRFSCAEAGPMKIISDYDLDSKPDVEGPPMAGSNRTTSPVDGKLRCRIDVDDDVVPGPLSM
ncbi:uncharacterized protein LOC114738714 [Neltuma alba]|uniref:uncharacterized protein LOC114738714 n=1 Tax=Neltuma alba TaxID=207710 RepID=UPI0010A4A5B1|nr:uncharacterized protein LOC114738714 [Prosopis alba]